MFWPVSLVWLAVQLASSCGAEPAAAAPPDLAGTIRACYATYRNRDYFTLQTQLAGLTLPEPERLFFTGQIEAAFLHDQAAEEALLHFLASSQGNPDWRQEAWLTLGNCRLRRQLYAPAAEALSKALAEPSVQFTPAERTDAQQNLSAARALASSPPQTCDPYTAPSRINATNSVDVGAGIYIDMQVNGFTEEAMFDTGANLNFATESFARRHNVRLSNDVADGISSTGQTIQGRLGMADLVKIGAITFHQVVFVVLPDQDLAFSSGNVAAVAGLPLIIPLRRLRFTTDNNSLEVGLASESQADSSPLLPNLAFAGLMPLVKLQYQGQSMPFVLDTGMSGTTLFPRFVQRFPGALAGATQAQDSREAIGSRKADVENIIPSIQLTLDQKTVLMKETPVFNENLLFLPPVFGMLGADFFPKGFELDFQLMRCTTLGPATAK